MLFIDPQILEAVEQELLGILCKGYWHEINVVAVLLIRVALNLLVVEEIKVVEEVV